MSHREFMIVLTHAHLCSPCRSRLLSSPADVFASHALTPEERETLAALQSEDFITPDLLARATNTTTAEQDEYRDQPVVRLRHL
jgi:hypothetical protein